MVATSGLQIQIIKKVYINLLLKTKIFEDQIKEVLN